MDAFVVRKRRSPLTPLFKNETFLLVPSVDDASDANNSTARNELTALLTANGGRVLATPDASSSSSSSSDTTSSRTVVVLLQRDDKLDNLSVQDIEMIARVLRRNSDTIATTAAIVVRAQWVRDCTAQQARLATHSYDLMRAVLALHKRPGGNDSSSVAHATDAFASDDVVLVVDGPKRQKVAMPLAAAAVALDAAALAAAAVHDELPRPHLLPWRDVHGGSLLILDARSVDQQQQLQRATSTPPTRVKIAAFDMDGTWIDTKSGKRFATNEHDWKWLHPTLVRAKLEALVRANYVIVLFSNQNGIATGNVNANEIKRKVEAIITKLNLPVLALLATQSDAMRKPRIGGWREMLATLGISAADVDMDASFYCGDAAGRPKASGRTKKDFAATDYKFALNVGIAFYTPEALFLASTQRIHTHSTLWDVGFDHRSLCAGDNADTTSANVKRITPAATQELVVLVGSPASGKTFFARTQLPTYVTVSQDELKTVALCKRKCVEALALAKSVVVDCTNRDARARSEWIALAKEQSVPVRCVEMAVPKPLAMHLNTFRSLTEAKKIPEIAIHTFYKNFVPPQVAEGFDDVVQVPFQIAPAGELSESARQLLCSFL